MIRGRKLNEKEIEMMKNGICPSCEKQGIQYRISDNEGHGGYIPCPNCDIFYFPIGKQYDENGKYREDSERLEEGIIYGHGEFCDKCFSLLDRKNYHEKKGGEIVWVLFTCKNCGYEYNWYYRNGKKLAKQYRKGKIQLY